MERILSEEELNELFKYKTKIQKNSYKILEFEKIIQKIFTKFSYKNMDERNKLIEMAFMCNGHIENNPKELICPKCLSKYVVSLLDGDILYRLFNGNEETKEKERKKFEDSKLFINRGPICGYYATLYKCLGCGYEW